MASAEEFLTNLGLEKYLASFEEHDIDADLLAELTSDDLKEIGITSLGHRKKILSAIKGVSSNDEPALPSAATVTESVAERREVTTVFAALYAQCTQTQTTRHS